MLSCTCYCRKWLNILSGNICSSSGVGFPVGAIISTGSIYFHEFVNNLFWIITCSHFEIYEAYLFYDWLNYASYIVPWLGWTLTFVKITLNVAKLWINWITNSKDVILVYKYWSVQGRLGWSWSWSWSSTYRPPSHPKLGSGEKAADKSYLYPLEGDGRKNARGVSSVQKTRLILLAEPRFRPTFYGHKRSRDNERSFRPRLAVACCQVSSG